jgi:hypothetical protein
MYWPSLGQASFVKRKIERESGPEILDWINKLWSESFNFLGQPSPAAPAPAAAAPTAPTTPSMTRGQARRAGRHERREARRTGRHERREARRNAREMRREARRGVYMQSTKPIKQPQ